MSEVVIVTGAAGGIGSATARRFAEDGATVLVADVDDAGASRTADEIKRADGRAEPYALDVTSRDAWEGAVAAAGDLGRLTAVVNNAGILRDRSLKKMDDDQWQQVLDVHLRGAFLGSQIGVREMGQNGGGAIVSISSTASFGSFGQANYSAAKGGIISLMRTVALEGARYGVRANAVAPGSVQTQMIDSVPDEVKEGFLKSIPLGRFADPSEIADAVAFLCSRRASYITGQLLVVDGGSTLGG
ncbi:MAG: SDR family oxidoreductase [Streptosporangiales bacterium]